MGGAGEAVTCCVSLIDALKAPDATRFGTGEPDLEGEHKHVRSTPAGREHTCIDSDWRPAVTCTGP